MYRKKQVRWWRSMALFVIHSCRLLKGHIERERNTAHSSIQVCSCFGRNIVNVEVLHAI